MALLGGKSLDRAGAGATLPRMADTIQPSDNAQATAISIAASMVFSGEVFESLRNADQPDHPEELALARAGPSEGSPPKYSIRLRDQGSCRLDPCLERTAWVR